MKVQNNIDKLILDALREDIPNEDITTNSIIKSYTSGKAQLICKQDGIIAGLNVFARVFTLLDAKANLKFYCKDGESVKKLDLLGEVEGDIRAILSGERTALNFLQRMSGIATYTRKVVDLLDGSDIKLLDTRNKNLLPFMLSFPAKLSKHTGDSSITSPLETKFSLFSFKTLLSILKASI